MRQVTKVRLEPGVERTGARSDSSSVSKACAQHRIGWFKQGSSAKQIFKTLETGVPRSAMVGYKASPTTSAGRWRPTCSSSKQAGDGWVISWGRKTDLTLYSRSFK